MALVKCPECGRENVSDTAEACPGCGYGVKAHFEKIKLKKERIERERKVEEQQKESTKRKEIKKNKVKKTIIKPKVMILSASILSCILIGIFVCIFVKKENEYKEAIENYNKENYEQAYNYFKNSNYKESSTYFQDTLKKYCNYLISNEKFYDAEMCLSQITDKEIASDLSNELNYAHALYNYNNGVFSPAYKILRTIKNYKDALQIMDNINKIRNIEGEWILYYMSSSSTDKDERGALKIDGWNAATYHGSSFQEAGSCKLQLNNDGTFTFKTADIEYQLEYVVGRDYLLVTAIRDSYYKGLQNSYAPFTPWEYYGDTDKMCFKRSSKNEVTKKTTNPEIGMTSEEIEQTNWGKPTKINKSTYSWGTTEQWCYPDNKYIYLDNGVVTAISE